MFTAGYNPKASTSNVATAAQVKQTANINNTPVLGPTASANVNLGGVQGGSNPYNANQFQGSNQLSPPLQSGWNQPPPQQGAFGNPQYNQPMANALNTGLVQQVPGPGSPNTGPTGLKPPTGVQSGPMSQQDKNSFSTAPTSKNASAAGPVGTQNRPVAPSMPGQKPNGVKQTGPSLAATTNFKASCSKTAQPKQKERAILPWDHNKQNYVYTDEAFELLKPKITKEQLKKVTSNQFRKLILYLKTRVGILFPVVRHVSVK